MGEELILACLAHRTSTALDWCRGIEAAKAATERDLHDLMEAHPFDSVADARAHLVGCAEQLEQVVMEPCRGTSHILFGDWVILLFGGSSWGDDPNPAFTVANAVAHVSGVRRAFGFDWPATYA